MAKTWMKAAEENGIPAAFVIRDGKIAWIGHPMSMDEPLAKITAGEWNTADMAKTRLAEKSKRAEGHGRPGQDLHAVPIRRLQGHALRDRGGDIERPRAGRAVRGAQAQLPLQGRRDR